MTKRPAKQVAPEGYNVWVNRDGSVGGFVHESASVHNTAIIKKDAVVRARASIAAFVIVGNCTCIGEDSHIFSDCVIGARVVIDQHVVINHTSKIGDDSRIREGVVINFEATIGKEVYVDNRVQIGQTVVIGELSHIATNVPTKASLAAETTFKHSSTICGGFSKYSWCAYIDADESLHIVVGCQNHKIDYWTRNVTGLVKRFESTSDNPKSIRHMKDVIKKVQSLAKVLL